MSETEFGSEMSGRSDRNGCRRARGNFPASPPIRGPNAPESSCLRERTEFFLRENPVPTVLGALALGLAIGLAIRYSSRPEEPQLTLKRALRKSTEARSRPLSCLG